MGKGDETLDQLRSTALNGANPNLVFWLLSFGAFGLPLMAVMWPVAVIHAIYIIVTTK